MKQLACEMCGSTNLVKQDGMFVCQECGTKYSVEEAKKMMMEEGDTAEAGAPVKSPAPIKTDNTSKIENYFTMAQNARNSGNNKEAEEYCNKILEIDPKHTEAWLMKGMVAAWQSTLANNRVNELITGISNAFENAKDEEFVAFICSTCHQEIEAPLVAKHAQAGQFVIFRLDEQGERVPVSVAGYDREKGTVTVMVQAAGKTTKMLHTVEQGDYISDFVGPLGKATEMEGLKKVCVVGGGVGCAIAYPIAKEMHARGIDVTFIGGFRSADIVILKEELKAASDKLIMCTDDGTYGEKGFTTVFLKNEIEANIKEGKPQFDRVIAIGPDIMMKFLADVTRPYGIKTIISLDPIMVDGTGMCGCCRVIVGGETKFACVDGPDFDAHEVDFDSLLKRAAFYKDEQDEAAKHICKITGGKRNG